VKERNKEDTILPVLMGTDWIARPLPHVVGFDDAFFVALVKTCNVPLQNLTRCRNMRPDSKAGLMVCSFAAAFINHDLEGRHPDTESTFKANPWPLKTQNPVVGTRSVFCLNQFASSST